jgi:hypothetical protein
MEAMQMQCCYTTQDNQELSCNEFDPKQGWMGVEQLFL